MAKRGRKPVPIEDRFFKHVQKGSEDECWLWLGSKNEGGYGRVMINGKKKGTHRVVWELTFKAVIPAGYFACHHCDNPPCVNPKHIFIGTNKDNMLDAMKKGRLKIQPRKPFCKYGHPTTIENTKFRNRGDKECLRCRKDRKNISKKRHKIRLRVARTGLLFSI